MCYPRPDYGIIKYVQLTEESHQEFTPYWKELEFTAWMVIIFYAGIFPGILVALLVYEHRAIVDERETPIMRATGFMHRHFRPQFWYFEVVHIGRKLFLTGYAIIISLDEPGSLLQLVWALNVAISVMAIEVQVRPFRRLVDCYSSLISSLAIIFSLIMCIVLRCSALVEDLRESDVQESLWQFLEFDLGQTTAILFAAAIAVFAIVISLMFYNVSMDKTLPRVMHQHSKRDAKLLRLVNGQRHHLFLSHVWKTGQDQARVIKQLLKEVLPGIRIFLDVDDLTDLSLLEHEISASAKVLVFISQGYFESKNCLRELVHAIKLEDEVEPELAKARASVRERAEAKAKATAKARSSEAKAGAVANDEGDDDADEGDAKADERFSRIFFVCESEQIHGKLTESQAMAELDRSYQWGKELWKKHLKDEEERKATMSARLLGETTARAESRWADWPLPYRGTRRDHEQYMHIRSVVCKKMLKGILWNRIKDFQQLTLVEVAEHLIQVQPGDPPCIPGGPLDEKVALPQYVPADGFHIYVSPSNAGALDFVYDELRHRFKGNLKIAYSQEAIKEHLESEALLDRKVDADAGGASDDAGEVGNDGEGGRPSRWSFLGKRGKTSHNVGKGSPARPRAGSGELSWWGSSRRGHSPKRADSERRSSPHHATAHSRAMGAAEVPARATLPRLDVSSSRGGSAGVSMAEHHQTTGACIFLIYLDGRTWTSENSHELWIEIEAQLSAIQGKTGVQPAILLLHERDELHHQAVDFETFFATTPPELIKMGLYQTIAEPLYAGQHRRRSLRKAAERLVELLQDPETFQDQVRWSLLKKEDAKRAGGALPGGAARDRSTFGTFGGVGENFAGIDGVPPSNFRLMDMLIFDPIDKLDNDPNPDRLVLSPMVELAQEAVRGYAARQGGVRRNLHVGAFSKKDEQKRLTIRWGRKGSMLSETDQTTDHMDSFAMPHVFVGGVERRVLWFRRVERTQEERDLTAVMNWGSRVVRGEERDLIVQQKGAKDIEKRMWREWRPPEMENALIVKVDEQVGGTIHVVREPRPGELNATPCGMVGSGTVRAGYGAILGTSRAGYGAIPGTSRAGYGTIPGTSRAGYGAISREPTLTCRGNIGGSTSREGKIRDMFDNPEREGTPVNILLQSIGGDGFAKRGDRGVRTAFDRVANALLQCGVEVVKEPAPDEIARPITRDVIASLSGAPPTEIPLSIISEIRRARHLWRVKREVGASVCEELPPSDRRSFNRRPADLSSMVHSTETERVKPQTERHKSLHFRSKLEKGLGHVSSPASSPPLDESSPASSPPLDKRPPQRRACFSDREHGTPPTDAPGTSCERPGVNRSPPGREGRLFKPKARSPNPKPISSRSQLEPRNSSHEEAVLTHESGAVSKPTRQRSEQSRGRPAAEGAKVLAEAPKVLLEALREDVPMTALHEKVPMTALHEDVPMTALREEEVEKELSPSLGD